MGKGERISIGNAQVQHKLVGFYNSWCSYIILNNIHRRRKGVAGAAMAIPKFFKLKP